AGHTVIVTRPAHQSAGTVAALRALGAKVIEFPAIRIEPVETKAGRAEVVPDDFDWLVYTSANAVVFAARRLKTPARARVAAIGPATAQARRHPRRSTTATRRQLGKPARPSGVRRAAGSARTDPARHRGQRLSPSRARAPRRHGGGS